MNDPNLPRASHEILTGRPGLYSTVTKCRVSPADEPEVTEGEAKLVSVLGGRFLREEHTGSAFSQPFHRLKFYGYNAATGSYEAVWMHDKSTAMLFLSGESHDSGRTIHWSGSYEDPDGGRMDISAETRQLDDDRLVQEVYGTGPEGEKFTYEETVYVRRG